MILYITKMYLLDLLLFLDNNDGDMVYQSRPELVSRERPIIDKMRRENGGKVIQYRKERALSVEREPSVEREGEEEIEVTPVSPRRKINIIQKNYKDELKF